jgi:hypothetical protein
MPVPDDATQLELTATRLGLQRFSVDDNQEPCIEHEATIAGPWSFTVPL